MSRHFSNERAFSEGWGLFNADGTLAIQRLDDPRSVDPSYPEKPVFPSDYEAVMHVLDAAERSEYHRAAAELMGEPA